MDLSAVFFILGALIGSFLNVCIVRLPRERSVVFPSSHCVHCLKPIAWYDNIPLISWLALRGKCRHCKAAFSFRYFLVELLTALVFWYFYRHFGLTPLLGPYLFMVSCFIVATFVDFAERIIPDEVSVGGMWAGIGFSILIPQLHPVKPVDAAFGGFLAGALVLICLVLTWIYPLFCKHLLMEQTPEDDRSIKIWVVISLLLISLINLCVYQLPPGLRPHALSFSAALSGYLIGGGLIYAMGLMGDIIFKKESMGGGDVKLMALVGAFMGWQLAVLTFFLAPFFGAVYGIVEKIRTKDSTIAYGPFLILGALMSLFWGQEIIRFILAGGFSF